MDYKFRNKNGITLIVLVVTIIILLILAAVIIIVLTGENGVLNRAGEAKEETEESMIKEEILMAVTSCKMEDKKNDQYQNIGEYLKIGEVTEYDNGNFKYCTKYVDYLVSIQEDETNIRKSTGLMLKNYVEVGDFVNYDAGCWNETKASVPGLKFGGYVKGENRGKSIYEDTLSGWRVLYKCEDGKVALIHAGIPEKFNVLYSAIDGVLNANSIKILRGSTNKIINEKYDSTPRSFEDYIDKRYAVQAKSLQQEDILIWGGTSSMYDENIMQTEDDLIKLDRSYRFSGEGSLWSRNSNGKLHWANDYGITSIRVVIILKNNVELKYNYKEKDMFGNDAWILN